MGLPVVDWGHTALFVFAISEAVKPFSTSTFWPFKASSIVDVL